MRVILRGGGVPIAFETADRAVLDYVVEYFDPWFEVLGTKQAEWQAVWTVRLEADGAAYAALAGAAPPAPEFQPCFAHDQRVLSLPAWSCAGETVVRDADRACFLRLRRGRVEIVGLPESRRWRFTLLWVFQELAAMRLRREHLDLHAASVAADGRGIVIAGAKGAGKTTLSFYLMQGGGNAMIANDRTFVGGPPNCVVRGMPTAVKILAPTLARHPQLCEGLPPVARPYLYSEAELLSALPSKEPVGSVDTILTPGQVAARLGANRWCDARLRVVLFPEICAEVATWSFERLATDDTTAALEGNLYGAIHATRPETLFEALGDGHSPMPDGLASRVAVDVPAFRLRLGPDAYADDSLHAAVERLAR
jgi:hypothetical protein